MATSNSTPIFTTLTDVTNGGSRERTHRLRPKVNKVGEVRMLRKLGPALLVVVGLFSGANASPLTFYTNEAAWLAAVSSSALRAPRIATHDALRNKDLSLPHIPHPVHPKY
jgi:hypothetical protein